ncbi:uncharacterized protein RCC_10651 [Ramularia collo-cygni]|uniref:Uncharacterized protein n=1 Tax=Ramularia collo-cygni TaxID=112498 RepID=A0A2D3VA43_9PEZI|nr:uncharacterized protein RCC_10651 [Ramularia collo-cygni]CZT24923.1 uncharacterized protein RCC_10651 [Ramularia collo-cygni]
MLNKALIVAAAASAVAAQRPEGTSICDYYTTALLKENNATNQNTLLTLVVNTAVIGNYTQPNVGIAVPGILNPNGTYMGTPVNLVPYFDGSLASTNAGGSAKSVNFLDDGGAAPLMMNKPANGTDSAQYMLLTHLYSYFGGLLGCTMVGNDGFPAYAGDASQYKVHKFMALDANEVGYFIQQVGLSAASFGVTEDDVAAVGKALNDTFGYRCAPAAGVIPKDQVELQSICTAEDCPLSPNATCDAYDSVMAPMSTSPASMATDMPSMSSSMGMPSSTESGAPAASYTGAANSLNVIGSFVAAAGAAAAFAL